MVLSAYLCVLFVNGNAALKHVTQKHTSLRAGLYKRAETPKFICTKHMAS